MKVGVVACAGRMGKAILNEILSGSGLILAGGIVRPGHPAIGQDLAQLVGRDPIGVAVGDDAAELVATADVLIEFSTPEASLRHAALATKQGKSCIIGTTGLDAAGEARLAELARRAPIVWAANMSVGVNVLQGLVRRCAATLGPDFDIEIVEMHHRHKVDAPSGTALALGRSAAEGRKVDLDAVADRGRDGLTGPREAGRIGFAAMRGGDVVGDHSVVFAGAGERVVLSHLASDRGIYARGAVRAARWVIGKPAGFYGMQDVLGLS
jgi:4-hydroxy-tetrahydrodipicolinate reductase